MAKGRIRSAIKKKIRGSRLVKPKAGGKRMRLRNATKSATARVMSRFGTVKEAIEKIDSQMKLIQFKIRDFEPKIRIEFKKGHFTVKTVEDGTELAEALRLRFSIFHKEYMHKRRNIGVDVDKLDLVCDHLVIRDDRNGRIVGTYRLNSSTFSNTYYSSSEFDLAGVLAMGGNILELGRAGIDKEYRTGVVIALLWRGISEYMEGAKTDILLGCASVKTVDPLEIGVATRYLENHGVLRYDLGVKPTKKYRVKSLRKVLDYLEKNPYEYDEAVAEKMIPTLFHSYIKMGFKAYGEPALDKEFQCIDYLIMSRLSDIQGTYRRRFKEKDSGATET